MDEVIVRSLQGLASAMELERMQHWRDASPENERRYGEIAEIWSVAGRAAPAPIPGRPPPVGDLIAQAEAPAITVVPSESDASVPERAPTTASELPASHRALFRAAAPWLAVAAGTAAIAFGLGRFANPAPGAFQPQPSVEVSTGPGELTTVNLPGGTSVRLGPESTLRVLGGDEAGDQSVWLNGRGFFGVVPDPSRTFTVRTPYGDAVALGTRFEVRTEAEEFRVLVVQGMVRVSSAGAEVELGPGVMSNAAPGVPPSATAIQNPASELDWMGQMLVFRATPLVAAAREIERRYGATIEIGDDGLEPLEITATFSGQPIEGVVGVICQILNADCEVEGSRVRIDSGASVVTPDGA